MMPRPEPWVLAAAAALAVTLAVLVFFQAVVALHLWRLRRSSLATLQDGGHSGPASLAQDAVVRFQTDMGSGRLAALVDRTPWLWDLRHLLVQSRVGWTLEGFVMRVAAAATVTGALSLLVFKSLWLAGLAFVLAGISPYLYVRWRKRRRILRLEMQLPDAIDLIARAVRAGHPLSAGLGMAAEEAPEPLASEFRITFEEQRFGLPFEEALLGLGDRIEIMDVRIFLTAILVQREVGGNLSEILETIAETMRARFNLRRQVRVYTAQGRLSGYTLAALPILVGFIISVINPGYMQTLFHEDVGRVLLVGAATMQLMGFLWIRRIVDIRY
jgi:tight adherence protein B